MRQVQGLSCHVVLSPYVLLEQFRTAVVACVDRGRAAQDDSTCRRSTSPRRARSSAQRRRRRRRPTLPAEAPLLGTLPIVTDQFATVTVVPREEIQRSPGATLGDLLFAQTRHHRFELRARRRQPADRARPRRATASASSGQRHRRRRRVRPRRRPLRAGRSAGGAADRGDPRAGDPALRLAGDRRRGQPTNNRIPDALQFPPRGHSAARNRTARRARVDNGLRRRRAARCRRGQFRRSMPTPSAAAPATTACRAIRICRPMPSPRRSRFNGRQPNSSARSDGQVGRRLVSFRRRLCRRRGVAVQQPLSHSRHRRRGPQHPHRHAADQGRPSKGEFRPQASRDRRDPVLARLHRLQAQRDRTRRPGRSGDRRRPPDLHQQGAGRPRRSPVRAVQSASSRRSPPRSACRPGISS